jgi:hypothetical protein
VPNHINVHDTLFLGLSARQLATFIAFALPAYRIWDQLTVVPMPVRGTLAGLVILPLAAFALIQPGDSALDEWAFAAVFAFAISPRRQRWDHQLADAWDWRSDVGTGWVDLAPHWDGEAVHAPPSRMKRYDRERGVGSDPSRRGDYPERRCVLRF